MNITAFRMKFVFACDEDTITADPALAIKKGKGQNPLVVDFDLLEEFDVREFRHLDDSWKNRPYNRP